MKLRNILIIVVLFIIVTMSSCKKHQMKNYLEGNWELTDIIDFQEKYTEIDDTHHSNRFGDDLHVTQLVNGNFLTSYFTTYDKLMTFTKKEYRVHWKCSPYGQIFRIFRGDWKVTKDGVELNDYWMPSYIENGAHFIVPEVKCTITKINDNTINFSYMSVYQGTVGITEITESAIYTKL